MGHTSAGGFTFTGDATFSSNLGYTQSSTLSAVSAATFAMDNTYINNTNHADSVSMGLSANFSGSSGFLWNDVSDESTTWTDVEYPN